MIAVQITVNFTTFLAYSVLATALVIKRKAVAELIEAQNGSTVALIWGGFIGFCGLTHLSDAIIFWWPWYRADTVLRLLTACVSMGAVFTLPALVRTVHLSLGRRRHAYRMHLRFEGVLHRASVSPDLRDELLDALILEFGSQGEERDSSTD